MFLMAAAANLLMAYLALEFVSLTSYVLTGFLRHNRRSGEAFRLACNQCHVLPDPQRYTAAQWPRVVARMQENMEWMNRVVGSKPLPGEPQLAVEEINAFLAKYARR